MEHNIRGTVGGRLPLEIILAITVAAAVWYICRRAPMPVALSSVVAGGVPAGHHLTVSDSALLLFPCLILALSCLSWTIRIWAILPISPVAVALAQTHLLGWRLSRPEWFCLRDAS